MSKHHPLRVIVGLVLLGLATSVLVAWGQYTHFVTARPLWSEFPVVDIGDSSETWIMSHRSGTMRIRHIRKPTDLVIPRSKGSVRHAENPEHLESLLFHNTFTRSHASRRSELVRGYYVANPHTRDPTHFEFHVVGWPRPSLVRIVLCHPNTQHPASPDRYSGSSSLDAALPIRPIAGGLALNTAFYAAFWGLVLVVLPAARRWNRSRRGLCAGCGYNADGLDTCPECGAASPPGPRAHARGSEGTGNSAASN